jgi:hypothetical protein
MRKYPASVAAAPGSPGGGAGREKKRGNYFSMDFVFFSVSFAESVFRASSISRSA